MALGLSEYSVDSEHMVENLIEEDQRYIKLFFIKHLQHE